MDNKNEVFSILLIIAAFIWFWPLGLFLLLRKLGVFGSASKVKRTASPDTERKIRAEKYKIMTEGQDRVSIEYLASAVGISYESALRDLQQLILEGQFGKSAYINYVDKTIVLTEKGRSIPRPQPSKADSLGNDTTKKSRVWLLVMGIALLFIGFIGMTNVVDELSWLGWSSSLWWDTAASLFMLAGGAASLFARSRLKKRFTRYKKYSTAIGKRGSISLRELSKTTGVPHDVLMRDLENIIEKDMLGTGVYIDVGDDLLILDPDARPQKSRPAEKKEDNEDRYKAIIREIRELNDAIPDPIASERIDRIEDLTSKIFNVVREKPEKLPQTKSFMSYYLPTTLKLLHSYASFEASGAKGENVEKAKRDIHRILDTLADGFEKQLDRLYETDAMDISSDIEVLESMMKRDGLSEDESGFGTAIGGH